MKPILRILLLLMGIAVAGCGTSAQGNPDVVSHDTERAERLDSISVVKADSVKIQGTFGNAPEKPATKRDK
jgi:hypothetical protein